MASEQKERRRLSMELVRKRMLGIEPTEPALPDELTALPIAQDRATREPITVRPPDPPPDLQGMMEGAASQVVGRGTNMIQMGRLGSMLGPKGAVGGAALGALMEPSGNETADLAALGVEAFFGGISKAGRAANAIASGERFGGLMLRGLATGFAVRDVTGDDGEAYLQAAGSIAGDAAGKFFRVFRSSKNTKLDDISASVTGSADELKRVEALTPDDAVDELRRQGFDLKGGLFQEGGRADLQATANRLAGGTGGGRTTLLKFAAKQDNQLNEIITDLADINPPSSARLAEIHSRLGNVNITREVGGSGPFFVQDAVTKKILPKLTPGERAAFQRTFGSGQPTSNLGARLIQPGSVDNAALEGVAAARKIAKTIDPVMDRELQNSMFWAIFNSSQFTIANNITRKSTWTSGSTLSKIVNQIGDDTLVEAFDDAGAAMLKKFAKAADTLDPSQMMGPTDIASARFVMEKAIFSGASGGAQGRIAEAARLSGAGSFFGLVTSIGLGNAMARIITTPSLAKAFNNAGNNADSLAQGMRALIADAATSGNIAVDRKNGKFILYPYSRGPEGEAQSQQTDQAPSLEDMLRLRPN